MDGRKEEISWQEQKDKWLWFGRKEWKSPHHFKYQACSERNREVQLCVTSGLTGVQKVQELKWRKLQNTKTTAQRTNRVKNERLKHNKSWSVSVVALLMTFFDLMSASVEDELVFLIFQTSQLIFRFYYGSWRAPTSLHCWLAGVYCSIFQYTQRKNVLLTIVFYLHMNFFWGGMTEFWHFSYPFNVRNYPSEFENKRTNTSSVILCQLHSLPFFGESVRGRAAECLSFYKVLV